jgi:glycosyltransferase involved in cell wall biosynthesis
MKILWFTWKDKKNPLAGGAEAVNESIAERLVQDGHEVILIVGGFKNALPEETIKGYKVIRLGNRWTIYWQAYKYYKKKFKGWADLVIDEVNTIPFGCKFYVKEKNIIICYQLCRQIWFYQMFFPLSLIGYLTEPIYLWLLRKEKVLTESQSTKIDLQNYGYKKDNIYVFNIGLEIEPAKDLNTLTKAKEPTILSLGNIRSMKRCLHIIKAFEIAKQSIPDLKLTIAGDASTKYGQKVLNYINKSKYINSLNYLGRVNTNKKIELMQQSHLICVTSVKEGWGIIVTEANSQGTPAIVYNVDGLRDSVKNDETGIICQKNTPGNLAENIITLLNQPEKYQTLRLQAWQWSKQLNYDDSFKRFNEILCLIQPYENGVHYRHLGTRRPLLGKTFIRK